MVRTLTSTLTSALNAPTKRPAIAVTIEDHVQHLATYQQPATPDAWHDACVASDGSLVRVQVTRNNFASDFKYQRITDPSQASQWTTWTTFTSGGGNNYQDGGCAVSNSGGVLRAFVQQGTGGSSLLCWSSLDNGQTWGTPTIVLGSPGGALIRGIASAGNNDVFFLYDVAGGGGSGAIGCSFFANYSWSALTSWTPTPMTLAAGSGQGLAVAWDGTKYSVVYSDGATLGSCTYVPAGGAWTQLPPIAPATSTAIKRFSPRLTSFDGLYHLTCVESDNGTMTGAIYSYPRVRQSVDLLHWSNGFIAHDAGCVYGVCFLKDTPQQGNAGTRYYLVTMPSVLSCSAFNVNNTQQYVDVSAAVLGYTRTERVGKPARLELLVDNTSGVYNALLASVSSWQATAQPLGPNASVVISEGYYTGTPPRIRETVQVGEYRINKVQIERSPQQNQLRITAYDASRNLDTVSRYQMSYSNQTIAWLISEICTRAGLFSISLPSSQQTTQVVPTFVLHAGQTYRRALDELRDTYGMDYFLDQNETLQFRELSGGDASIWTYQPEIELVTFGSDDARGNHVIVSGKPPSGSTVPLGSLTTGEAYDDIHIHAVGLERVIHHADIKLTTTQQCQLRANLLLAQEQRSQVAHQVSVPLNPALQLLDVITPTDSAAPQGSGQSGNVRIIQSEAIYQAQHALYEMHLHLEGA